MSSIREIALAKAVGGSGGGKTSLADATVTAGANKTYNGQQQTQSVTVVSNTVTLTETQDYTVSGNTGTNAGTYDLTVTGVNNFGGSKSVEWSIAKAQSSVSVSPSSLIIYRDQGSTGTAELTVTGGGAVSASSSDNSVATASVSGNTLTVTAVADGQATITVNVAGTDNWLASSATLAVIVQAELPSENVYGVEWNYSNSSTVLTRTGDAVSFTNPAPATSLSGAGTSPFDDIQPWAGMKRYNVINGNLIPDTDQSFNETSYDTVVYIPEFYYKASKDTANSKWNWSICATSKEGYEKHPGSGCYVGRFHTSGSSSAVYTKSGVAPLGNVTRANFRTYSAAKGSGWRQLDLKVWSAIQMLYLVEFANWNSQDQLGTGQDSGSVQNTGGTTGAAYHTIMRSGASNAYRWIENPYSNVYTWVDGFVTSDRASYVGIDPASYGDTTSGFESAGITLPSSGYISGIGYSEKCAWAFIPDASGDSDNTYVTDRVGSGTGTGTCVLGVGGSWNASDYWGLFYFVAASFASGLANNVGSRLLYQP